MENTILIFALIMLVTGVLTIATTSIGLECYTYTGMDKDGRRVGNMWFMGVTLFFAILLTLAAFPAFYMAFTM